MQRLRVGIIGQGRSGLSIHAHSLTSIEGLTERYQIVAAADPLEDRAKRAETDFGCAPYTDYRQMLKRDDLDLVINASPSHLHVPITLETLEAGHNCLSEKPFARRAADVDRMIAAAAKSGKLLAVFQQSRYAPYYQQVLEVLRSGVLGRIVMAKIAFNGYARRWDWQTLQEMDGGNLLNTGPHPLDQALGIIGRDCTPDVWCRMDRVNTFGDAEDHVKLLLTAQDQPTIDLEISSCCAYPLYTYQVYGSLGGLTGTMTELKWRWFKPEEAPVQTLIREPLPGPSYCGEKLTWHEESWKVPEAQGNLFDSMAGRFYSDLFDSMTQGKPLVIPPEQVRQQIAVIEECHRQNPMNRLS